MQVQLGTGVLGGLAHLLPDQAMSRHNAGLKASLAGAARRLHKCSRAVSHTPQGGITQVHDFCARHIARASSSSLSTAVLHSVGARRRRAGAQSARPLRRASEGAGCLIFNRRGSCEPRVVDFCGHVGTLTPSCETCATVATRARARRAVPRWELQHEPPSLTRSSRSALL